MRSKFTDPKNDFLAQGAQDIGVSQEVLQGMLDRVAEKSAFFMKARGDSVLRDVPEEKRQGVLENATYKLAREPERQKLYIEIFKAAMVGAPKELKSDKPIFIHFAGPNGGGRDELRAIFKERMAAENVSEVMPYTENDLEEVYQYYKEAMQYAPEWDFDLLKKMLPEYDPESHDDTFAMIRAEAAALNGTMREILAPSIGANVVYADQGDRGMGDFAKGKAEVYRYVVIGVTSNPAINAQILMNQGQATEELGDRIRGFSASGGLAAMVPHADKAALLNADNGYDVIAAWNGVNLTEHHPALYNKFLSYGDMSDAQIKVSMESVTQANVLNSVSLEGAVTPPFPARD